MKAALHEEPLPELLEACFRGDAAGQSKFFLRYHELITRAIARTLSRYCSQPPVASDVDDLTQEVFEKLLRNHCSALASVRGASCIDAWLTVVARNHTVDALRSEGARARAHVRLRGRYSDREMPVHACIADTGDVVVREEEVKIAAALLEELPPVQRLSMQMFYEHGLSYEEIAAVLGQPANTVASHLRRARARLIRAWRERHTAAMAGGAEEGNGNA